jgi:hypothetical protein
MSAQARMASCLLLFIIHFRFNFSNSTILYVYMSATTCCVCVHNTENKSICYKIYRQYKYFGSNHTHNVYTFHTFLVFMFTIYLQSATITISEWECWSFQYKCAHVSRLYILTEMKIDKGFDWAFIQYI